MCKYLFHSCVNLPERVRGERPAPAAAAGTNPSPESPKPDAADPTADDTASPTVADSVK